MKHTTTITGLVAVALAFGLPLAQAKEKAAKLTGQILTATGCLTKEAKEKNEYQITGEDGKTWGLKSKTVKLNEHLNHKVTITGKVTKDEQHGTEAGDMNVTDVKMVSDTCK